MIYIKYPNNQKPEQDWLDRANELTQQLKNAPDKTTRTKIIEDNASLWGEVKEWLLKFSHDKCWFSEARDTFSDWHVEHFRPKNKAKEPDRDGYWWRAFDYLNYRICGSVGNAKKGAYFPLRPETLIANCPTDNCDDEAPLLLDPTCAADVMLLTFTEGGMAAPSESEGWPRERAEKSILRYKLNEHPPLLRAREQLWNQCKLMIDEMETLIALQKQSHSPTRQERIRSFAAELTERCREHSQFSAVARSFLEQCPRPWAKRLVA